MESPFNASWMGFFVSIKRAPLVGASEYRNGKTERSGGFPVFGLESPPIVIGARGAERRSAVLYPHQEQKWKAHSTQVGWAFSFLSSEPHWWERANIEMEKRSEAVAFPFLGLNHPPIVIGARGAERRSAVPLPAPRTKMESPFNASWMGFFVSIERAPPAGASGNRNGKTEQKHTSQTPATSHLHIPRITLPF